MGREREGGGGGGGGGEEREGERERTRKMHPPISTHESHCNQITIYM